MFRAYLSKIRGKGQTIFHAATHRNFPRVLSNSMPKAGTHLLARLITLLGFHQQDGLLDIGPNEGLQHVSLDHVQQLKEKLVHLRNGFFTRTHMYFFPEIAQVIDEFQIKALIIIRDPRDVCVSDALFIDKRQNHRLQSYYLKMSQGEKLMASIVGMTSDQLDGAPPSLDIGSHYLSYLDWVKQNVGFVVRFEDLIGDKGGGDDRTQRETVAKIANYLGLRVSKQKLADVCAKVFWPKASTFRKGQIGDWKNHFGPEHLSAFKRVIGTLMQDFGYQD